MASEKLANKYRPRTLDELIGQDVAVSKIRGMLDTGNISPTMLISGPYGTGKTSLARLIARYLNCTQRKNDGSTCEELQLSGSNKCPSCYNSDRGQHSDYIEVNCGDTRGIDDMRQIIESSTFAPRGNYRVICLDEVQELPKASISALLKPLEEPSPRTIWILCTTAKDKILPTIKSRCLDLTLRPVSNAQICELIQTVNAEEAKLGNSPIVPDTVVKQIAELVDGHPRSALAALEGIQNVLKTQGASMAADEVQQWLMDNVVGVNQYSLATRFINSLLDGNPQSIKLLDSVSDADQFLNGCIRTLQSVCLGLAGSRRADPGAIQFIGSAKRKLSLRHTEQAGTLADILGHFVRALQAARSGTDPVVSLDLAALESLAVTTGWDKVD